MSVYYLVQYANDFTVQSAMTCIVIYMLIQKPAQYSSVFSVQHQTNNNTEDRDLNTANESISDVSWC